MSAQQPDTKPGNYYVSILCGNRHCLALGPFRNDHAAALAQVQRVWDYVAARCSGYRDAWFSYGTCRIDLDQHSPPGKLNDELL